MNRNILIDTLNNIITDKVKVNYNLYYFYNEEIISVRVYYLNLQNELVETFNLMFDDVEFLQEQEMYFNDYESYINDLINDCFKEDFDCVEM